MIREFKLDDLEQVMSIWLETNLKSHNFIAKSYWKNNYDMVKLLLPKANVYVYDVDGNIQGFVGVEKGYIAGIFVLEQFRSMGIGYKLLGTIKDEYEELTLKVYDKNTRAINFYLKENFKIIRSEIDKETREIELTMMWSK
ncbi:MAG: GNAT family N-acetyltransferase [Lachnospirales bacterium]